jgi:hypothetical protein
MRQCYLDKVADDIDDDEVEELSTVGIFISSTTGLSLEDIVSDKFVPLFRQKCRFLINCV